MQHFGIELESLGRIPIGADNSRQYLILRLLLGTATVRFGTTHVQQNIDYSQLPQIAQTKRGAVAFKDFLSSYAVGGNGKRFIQVTKADNRKFYGHILAEFLNYFIQTKRGAHTAAFVFLYRAIERISYSVPLLYASVQKDYFNTFNDLKNVFDTKSSFGEFGLFKKFLKQGRFIDPVKLAIKYDINFRSSTGNQTRYFNVAKAIFNEFDFEDPSIFKLQIEFQKVVDLLVTVRNRFFHARTGDGQTNIQLEDVWNPDEFFENLNPVFCSFLAVVALHTLSSTYRC